MLKCGEAGNAAKQCLCFPLHGMLHFSCLMSCHDRYRVAATGKTWAVESVSYANKWIDGTT